MKSDQKQCCEGLFEYFLKIGSLSTFVANKEEFEVSAGKHLCGYHRSLAEDFRRGKFPQNYPHQEIYRFLYYLHSHPFLQRCSEAVVRRAAKDRFGIGDNLYEQKVEPILQRNRMTTYHRCLRSLGVVYKGN